MKIGIKTVIGGLIWGVGTVAGPEAAAQLSPIVAGLTQAVGGILALLGLRDAAAKNGSGV